MDLIDWIFHNRISRVIGSIRSNIKSQSLLFIMTNLCFNRFHCQTFRLCSPGIRPASPTLAIVSSASGQFAFIHHETCSSIMGYSARWHHGFARNKYLFGLFPRYQLQVEIVGIVLVERAVYLLCNRSTRSRVERRWTSRYLFFKTRNLMFN